MYLGRIETGKSYKRFYIPFILICLGILAGIVYFSLARATIVLAPQKSTFTHEFEVMVAETTSQTEVIPGKLLSTEIEESRLVKTNDVKGFDAKAKGKVTIFNNREKDQPLLARTRLLSDSGVLFRTDVRVVVPAGGTAEVAVTADQEGKTGNIGPSHFTIVNIWKGWQDKLYAESTVPMTGGYTELPYVYNYTIDKSFDLLAEQLYAKALAQLSQQISSQEKILESAVKNEILEFSASVEPEIQMDNFTIKVKVRTIALVFNEEKLKGLAAQKIQEVAPKDQEFLGIQWDTFTYKLTAYDLEAKSARLMTSLAGEARSKISADIFQKEELIGLDRYEVKEFFKQFQDIGEAEVYFAPFWVHKVPSMVDHFEIQIKNN